jgi:hypothetical protein
MFIKENNFEVLVLKIFELAIIINLAIQMLKIIKVPDSISILENGEIDQRCENGANHINESGVIIISVAIINHQ